MIIPANDDIIDKLLHYKLLPVNPNNPIDRKVLNTKHFGLSSLHSVLLFELNPRGPSCEKYTSTKTTPIAKRMKNTILDISPLCKQDLFQLDSFCVYKKIDDVYIYNTFLSRY